MSDQGGSSLTDRVSQRVAKQRALVAAHRRARAEGGVSPSDAFRWAIADNYRQFAVLVVVAVVLGIVFRHHLHWGDVPTWVLATTTLLAFVAAAFAGVVAYELLRVEHARDRRAERERAEQKEADRRVQASKVAAWYAETPMRQIDYGADDADHGSVTITSGDRFRGAAIRNASDLPVYQVRVSFCVPADPWQDWREGERYSEPLRNPLPPGSATVALPDDIRQQEEASAGKLTVAWQVVIEFTDAGGERWRRDADGRLVTGPRVKLSKGGP